MAYLSLPESHWRLNALQLNKHEVSWLLGTEEKSWWFSTVCHRSLLIWEVEYGGLLLFPSLGTFPKILVKEIRIESPSICPVASNFCIFNLAVKFFKLVVVLKLISTISCLQIVRKTTFHKLLLSAWWRIGLCLSTQFKNTVLLYFKLHYLKCSSANTPENHFRWGNSKHKLLLIELAAEWTFALTSNKIWTSNHLAVWKDLATFLFKPICSLFSFLVAFVEGNGKTKILQGRLVFPAQPKPQSFGNQLEKNSIAVIEPSPAFLLCSKLPISCTSHLRIQGMQNWNPGVWQTPKKHPCFLF